MTDPGDAFEQLSSRVDALEQRVSRLEISRPETSRPELARPEVGRLEKSSTEATAKTPLPATSPAAEKHTPAPQIPETFAVFGKSLLGIAGAYLLRALTDGASASRPLIAAAGILYALAWLMAAARASARQLASTCYAATSALILVPMLWEMCLRFHVLSPMVAAAVLAIYTAQSAHIGWRLPRSPAFALSYAAAAAAALMLSIATHAMAAFTLLLLAMLLACEIGRLLRRDAVVRSAIALAADFAVWTTLFIYRSPAATRSDYPDLSAAALVIIGCLPFLITFPHLALRVLRLRLDLTIFDVAQAALSFVLVGLAFLWILPGTGTLIVGILCAAFAIACYAALLGPMRPAKSARNSRAVALWSAALTGSAAFLLFPMPAASVVFCALAFGCIVFKDRLPSRSAELHGVLYLGIAAVTSGQVAYAAHALAGRIPAPAPWPVLVASATAILVYLRSGELPSEPWQAQSLHLGEAMLAASSIAALLAHGLVGACALVVAPANYHVAFLRTFAVCVVAITLAFTASRLRRLELKRVAYLALAFVATKLIFEDLRHGHLEFTAASIGIVALTLISVPRLAQQRPV